MYNMSIGNMILELGTPLHAYFVPYVNSCVSPLSLSVLFLDLVVRAIETRGIGYNLIK